MMRLVFSIPDRPPYEIPAEPAELRIGRGAACDIVIDDPSISRAHAVIRRVGESVEIEDLGSANGTFMNGSRIQRARLGPGDQVRLGASFQISLEDVGAAQASAGPSFVDSRHDLEVARPPADSSFEDSRHDSDAVRASVEPAAVDSMRDSARARVSGAESVFEDSRLDSRGEFAGSLFDEGAVPSFAALPPASDSLRGGDPRGSSAASPSRTDGAKARRSTPWMTRVEFVLTPAPGSGGTPFVVCDHATTVGSEAPARWVIAAPGVARFHARLDFDGDVLSVVALKGGQRIPVNGTPTMSAKLSHGDTVQFGSARYAVQRRQRFDPSALSRVVVVLAVLGLAGWGVLRLAAWTAESRAVAEQRERIRHEAVANVRRGIASFRRGDTDYAVSHLTRAAEAMLLVGLAPEGASIDDPAAIFHPIVSELPAEDREFPFAQVLDRRNRQRPPQVESLSPHDYVRRQVRLVAVELGMDEDVPEGFVEAVWLYVTQAMHSPGRFQRIIDRSPRYMPMLRQRLAAARLPEMFAYVAWVESSLDPVAVSPAGAVGLWQFMPAKAKERGLHVGPDRDDRTNPLLATDAAAREIAVLINRFGPEQIPLALASYNRGWMGVLNQVDKIAEPMMPSSKRFWYLVQNRKLPLETQAYVPRIFAMRIMGVDPERFGFRAPR